MNKKFSVLIKGKIKKFNKIIKIPSDKSCSIRALLFSSICIGKTEISNLLESEDVLDCVRALKTLGVKIVKTKKNYQVYGNGLGSFKANKKKIWVGNSGTLCRILSGFLATNPGKFYLHGDKSLSKRDMSRIINPLEKIGAFFYPKDTKTLPYTIEGTTLPLAQNYIDNIGSAQVKSSFLAAFSNTPGKSTIEEKKISRNHTEILLKNILADIKIKKIKKGNLISLVGKKNLHSFSYTVGSDPSSSAFLVALALLVPDSKITIHNCLLNKTRFGFYKVLKENAGAKIKICNIRKSSSNGELMGSIIAQSSALKPINCPRKLIPSLIDELPILFVIAGLTKGISKFKNIFEVTKKESNRIEEMRKILIQSGIKCESTKDSIIIHGQKLNDIKCKNKLIKVETDGDHRICLSAKIFALATGIKTVIKNFETVNTSFPGAIKLVRSIGGKIEIKRK